MLSTQNWEIVTQDAYMFSQLKSVDLLQGAHSVIFKK